MSDLPDYYAVLEIAPTATEEQIRTAYKKAALKWHPDRVPSDSPERPNRTRKFQRINDAYYTLSEKSRRRDYDEARRWHTGAGTSADPFDEEDVDEEVPRQKGGGGFPWSAFGFGGGQTSGSAEERFANDQFKTEFEDMMNDAGLSENDQAGVKVPTKRFWGIVGGIAGGMLGFIAGNFVGAATGAVAGKAFGDIRDRKGKPVYQVFQELDQGQKAKVLSELAAKLFAGAIS